MPVDDLKKLQVKAGLANDTSELDWLDEVDLESIAEVERQFADEASPSELKDQWMYFSQAMTTPEGHLYCMNGDPLGGDRPGTCDRHIHWFIPKSLHIGEFEVVQEKPCRSFRLRVKARGRQLGTSRIDSGMWYHVRTWHNPNHHRGFRWATYTDDRVKRELLTHPRSTFQFNAVGDGWFTVKCKEPDDRGWEMTHVGSNSHVVTGQKERNGDQAPRRFKPVYDGTAGTVNPFFRIVEGTKNERLRVESDNALLRYAADDGEVRERFQFVHEGVAQG